jgi:nitrogen fixation/metabolism regulation signal transduction histidine kinase
MIFENQLLSPFINPHALNRILQSERSFVTREQVGNLVYNVAYSAVISPKDGTLLGIAAVPFYQSAYLLEKMQIQVLANIISVFTIIFIVLLIISYWVSTWLTFPLRMITQKLGRISLIQSNQPLEWKSDDEIGIMVKEYNQMLSTLSNNKRELERVQRERAWREIAQQVAHEIKNPLTPIKLTFQQLERLSDQDPRKMEKLRTAIATVLSQVEILDGVASSFSTFAKMPEPVLERIDLISLLVSCKSLHEQSADIVLDVPHERIEILADQKLLSRIFSNLIINAIQSARSDSSIKVKISVKVSDNRVTINFTDNGSGIPESLKDKIFLPHFSTKQTGSGLGLAIAKQGIEQMGGSINFESKVGEGSTFWIEFPVIKT